MSPRRVGAVARRVASQFRRDHRTLGLLFGAPILIMTLVGALWGATGQTYRVIVASDQAPPAPLVEALRKGPALEVTTATIADGLSALRAGDADAVLSTRVGFASTEIVVTLEGSDPFRRGATLQAIQGAMIAAATTLAPPAARPPALQVDHVYGGEDFSLLDHLAPLLIGFFAFFLTFLLSAVSFLRERTSGTLERLLATPLRRAELVVGYLMGFGLFALVQAAVLVAFTIFVLRVRYEGNIATIFLIEAMLVIVAVSMGLFVSAFARTELQAVQFIPVVILPQAFLSGLLVPVGQLPELLRPFSVIMPLTYAMEALRDVMIKGFAVTHEVVIRDLLVLALFAVVTIAGAILSIRREVA